MNRRNEDLKKMVDSNLGRFDSPPMDEMADSKERTLRRLRSAAPDELRRPASHGASTPAGKWRIMAIATAAAAVAFVSLPFLRSLVVPDVYAVVETSDGLLYRLGDGTTHPVRVGERIGAGTSVRSDNGAVLKLSDGARIEMQGNSELSLESASDGVRIRVNDGSVRVTPARQPAGNLYVQNHEVTVPVIAAVSVGSAASGQTAPPAAKPLEFEAVSLRPNPAGPTTRLFCKGVDGVFSASGPTATMVAPSVAETIPLGRCVGANVTLANIISTAYRLPFSWRITNNADWREFTSETYQVEAKAENPASATTSDLRQMLQTLLTNRYKLRIHRDQKEAQGYALVLAKGGTTLKEITGGEGYLEPSSQASPSRSIHGRFRMATFSELMTDYIGGGTEVADMTGLSGLYEVHLTLNRVGAGGGVRTPEGPEPGTNLGMFDPPFFRAIEQQLGLKLELRKVPVEVIVIDHVEKASEN